MPSPVGVLLQMQLGIGLKGNFANSSRKVFVIAADSGGLVSTWTSVVNWDPGTAPLPPVIVSGTPSNPVGSPQLFNLVVRDPNGYANLSRVYFSVNTSPTASPNTCHGFYDAAANAFFLYNDALTALMGPLSAGTSGTLQNTQCQLSGAQSRVLSTAGTDMNLALDLARLGGFGSGTKNLYLIATDAEGNNSGWQSVSAWTGASSQQAPVIYAPAPPSLNGSPQTVNIIVRDGNGGSDVSRVYFVVNTTGAVVPNGCHGFYDRPTDAFYLYNDALSAVSGPLTPGAAGTIQNSQCAIDGALSPAPVISGTDITVGLRLTLKGAFGAASQGVYGIAVDSAGNVSPWGLAANWGPAQVVNQPPTVLVPQGYAVAGSPQTVPVAARDTDGAADVSRIYFLVDNSAAVSPVTCHGFFDRQQNAFFLYNDALNALLGPVAPGSATTVQNSQCSISGTGSTVVSNTGTDLRVNMSTSLKGTFASLTKNIYLWATDLAATGTGWVQIGTWAPPLANQAPVILQATPTAPQNSTQTFTVNARDANGFSDITRIYFLVNTSAAVTPNSCHGYFDLTLGTFYLYNDGVTSLMGPLAADSAGAIENSQCKVTGTGSRFLTGSGTDLSFGITLTQKGAAATSVRKVYFLAADAAGANSTWTEVATWTPPSPQQPPILAPGTAAEAFGTTVNMVFTGRDPNGYADIDRIYFLIAGSPNVTTGGCHGFYERASDSYFLYNDGLTGLVGPLQPGAAGFIENSQCKVNGPDTYGTTNTTNDLSIRPQFERKGAFASGSTNIYVWITDSAANGTGWLKTTTWSQTGGGANQAPTVSVNNVATVSGTVTLGFFATDPNGSLDIKRLYFLVESGTNVPANTCHGFYDQGENAFYLYNDGLTALLGPLAAGANGVLENSQCILDGPTSFRATTNTSTPTLAMNITLSRKGVSEAKNQNAYILAQDYAGAATGWVQVASWVPAASRPASPPSLSSFSPRTPSGSPQTFQVAIQDFNGPDDIQTVSFLVNDRTIPLISACYGYYDAPAKLFYLYGDDGVTKLGPVTPGSAGSVENSQCRLNGTDSKLISSYGVLLKITIGLTLKSPFDSKSGLLVYLSFTDKAGTGRTAFSSETSWLPPNPSTPQPPTVFSITSTPIFGSPQDFLAAVSDPNGYADITRTYFLVADSPTPVPGSCYGYYDRATNAVYLLDDSLNAGAPLGPLAVAAQTDIQNSSCTVHGAGLAVGPAGGTSDYLRLRLSLRGAFANTAHKVYFLARDAAGAESGWKVASSNWTPGTGSVAVAPAVVSGTPATASGATQTLTLAASDANGAVDISRVYFLIGPGASATAGSCHGFYDRASNSYYLYNDDFSATVGSLPAGGGGTLTNSNCELTGPAAVSLSGNNLSAAFPLKKKGALAASQQKVFFWVVDNEDLGTGWIQAGVWNP